ncbi:MAG: EamA family transporter [Candidatus Eisenbacteria bacterium]|nr:EamA family transporter [Candidatus Eisenbacteria bacterium]
MRSGTEGSLTRSTSAVLATVLASLLWGSSFSVIKIGLRTIDPYWFVFLRFSIAAALALVYLWSIGRLGKALALARHPLVIWLGVANAVGFIFQFKGQTLTTAVNAALIINSCTIYVAIVSKFVFGERFGPPKLLGVALGILGVYLVTTGGRLTVAFGESVRGDLIVLGGALAWTAFIVLDKKVVELLDVDVRSLTGAMVLLTALSSLPAAVIFGRGEFPGVSPELWTIPYTSVFCTILPFFLWTWGLKAISATTSSVVMLSEVVFALVIAALLLGERLTAGGFAGSALIVVAILLASREPAVKTATGPDVVPE